MKALNREKILGLLLASPLLSRVELAQRASVSPAVVSNIIKDCLEEEIVREVSEGPSRGGRKPILLSFVPESRLAAGLIPATVTEFAVADLAGRILFREKITGKAYPTPGEQAGYLKKVLGGFLQENELSWDHLVALGIGIPGIYDPVLDRIHKMGKVSGLMAWEGASVREIFSRELPCPVLVFDKVVAIAFSEGILRSDDSKINLVYLHLGRGVGAGLILDGKIYRGSQGAAGEVGYMVDRFDDSKASPVSLHDIPALEDEISLNSLLRKYREACGHSIKSREMIFSGEDISALVQAFRKGERRCREIVEPVFERAAELVVNLAAVLNPGQIVLGGELTEIFADSLFQRIRDRLHRSVLFPPSVEPVTLGKDEEIVGALYFAIDDFFNQLTGGHQGLTASFLARYTPNG